MKRNLEAPVLVIITVLSTLSVWLPFFLNQQSILGVQLSETGSSVISRYLDGPLYVVVSKTLYALESQLYDLLNLPAAYFSSHFPLYPLLILAFSFIGFFNSMLFVTLLSSIGASLAFYFLLKDLKLSKKPFLLTVFFVFFPFRWLLYHSIGASEALFVFLSLASFYFFRKQDLTKAGAVGTLAVLTRPVGILLFPAFFAQIYFKRQSFTKLKNSWALLLIPLSLALLIAFFAVRFSIVAPFAVVNAFYFQGFLSGIIAYNGAVGGEFVAFLLLIYAIGALRLLEQKHYDFFAYSLLFILPALFLSHNDLSRNLIPIAPFCLFLGFKEVWESKYSAYALPLVVLAGLLYAWSTIPHNLISNAAYFGLLR